MRVPHDAELLISWGDQIRITLADQWLELVRYCAAWHRPAMTGVMRAALKRAAFEMLGSTPTVRAKIARLRDSGALTILNLHRVAPDDRSAYRPLDPSLFERLLIFVKEYFEPVTFGTLHQASNSGRPRIILSFDDGYADFAHYAAPLLRKYGVKVNHNIIPACVESGRPPLNVLMQDFVGRAGRKGLDHLQVPGFQTQVPRSDRGAFGHALSAFIKSRSMADQASLASELLPQVDRQPDFSPTAVMTLKQIVDLSSEHEFGAHSFAHASLGEETDDFVREDVAQCRRWFESELGQPMRIYAVPNGSYRQHQLDILRQGGAETILLVDEAFSSAACSVHRRFTFDARSAAEMRFKATGGFRWPG